MDTFVANFILNCKFIVQSDSWLIKLVLETRKHAISLNDLKMEDQERTFSYFGRRNAV